MDTVGSGHNGKFDETDGWHLGRAHDVRAQAFSSILTIIIFKCAETYKELDCEHLYTTPGV